MNKKLVIITVFLSIALVAIIVALAVVYGSGTASYFDSFVEASMRKDVLTTSPSENGATLFKETANAEHCFHHFDANKNGGLDKEEFSALLRDLFRDENGKPHQIDANKLDEMFSIFNKSGSSKGMAISDFKECWSCWIKTILRPVSAIVIVDVQNDFITGSLAIKTYPAKEDGADAVPPINNMLDTIPFDNIYYSKDWHPTNHISFFDNLNLTGREFDETSPILKKDAKLFNNVVFKGPPKTNQTLWPRHCVQGSEGAEFHKDLKVHPQSETILKGHNPKIDSYSAFFDNGKLAKTELEEKLRAKGVTDVYTCGIATDICVSYTSNDAQDLGFRTILIEDAAKGIFPEKIKSTKESIKNKNGLVVNSLDVKALVQGQNRPVELGYQAALQCQKKIGK